MVDYGKVYKRTCLLCLHIVALRRRKTLTTLCRLVTLRFWNILHIELLEHEIYIELLEHEIYIELLEHGTTLSFWNMNVTLSFWNMKLHLDSGA